MSNHNEDIKKASKQVQSLAYATIATVLARVAMCVEEATSKRNGKIHSDTLIDMLTSASSEYIQKSNEAKHGD